MPRCVKSHPVYVEIERAVAEEECPEGRFLQVAPSHEMYLDKPEVAVNAVKRVASK